MNAELITGKELAKRLGVSPSQITIWRQAGIIPAEISEGRCQRYDEDRVREVLAERARHKKGGSR